MIWNTRKIRSGFRQGLQIFLWYDPKLGWHLEDFRGFVRSPDRTFGVFEMRSGDRTAFLGLLKFCPNFGQDFLLFTTPVPLKKIVYKLIEIVCKLFFLVIFTIWRYKSGVFIWKCNVSHEILCKLPCGEGLIFYSI